MAARKLTVKKFDGNDMYSYAVFYADEVRGLRSPIFYGEARPVIAGLSKMEAEARKKRIAATMA
ncbi:MAG: hypothetical protein LC650_03370 [Actinobacteria bacterium]|nr:hypothetical protein [Actinomycetota bacterium]